MNEYECCFCGKGIDKNIIALLAIANWEKDDIKDDDKPSQQWFCHLNCLKKTLCKPEYLVLED